jgi:hypothetical protein
VTQGWHGRGQAEHSVPSARGMAGPHFKPKATVSLMSIVHACMYGVWHTFVSMGMAAQVYHTYSGFDMLTIVRLEADPRNAC